MLIVNDWRSKWFDEGLRGLAENRELAKREYVPNLAHELLAARKVVKAAKAFPITGKGRQRAWGDDLRKAITEYDALAHAPCTERSPR